MEGAHVTILGTNMAGTRAEGPSRHGESDGHRAKEQASRASVGAGVGREHPSVPVLRG